MPGIIDQLELPEEEPKVSGSIIDQLELPDEQLAPTATGGSIIDQLDLPEAQETPSNAANAQPALNTTPSSSKGFFSSLFDSMVNSELQKADREAKVGQDVGKIFSPSGQSELLADPETAGIAGGIIGASTAYTGLGDSPRAETYRENLHNAKMEGREYTGGNPLALEQAGGGLARMLTFGGMGLGAGAVGATEAGIKAADIDSHEPGKLGTVGGAARVAATGLTAGLAMKAGAAVEGAIARSGVGAARGAIENALADAGIGVTANTIQRATEMLAAGVKPTSEEFWQGLVPTKEDLIMAAPGAAIAGVGGARSAGARKALMEGEVLTPAREAELQTDLQGEVDALRMEGQARAEARAQREQAAANAVERQRIADVDARAAQMRDLLESERAATQRAQEQHSIAEARRNIEAQRRQAMREAQDAENAFRENPTMENAEARVAAIDRANELERVLRGSENATTPDADAAPQQPFHKENPFLDSLNEPAGKVKVTERWKAHSPWGEVIGRSQSFDVRVSGNQGSVGRASVGVDSEGNYFVIADRKDIPYTPYGGFDLYRGPSKEEAIKVAEAYAKKHMFSPYLEWEKRNGKKQDAYTNNNQQPEQPRLLLPEPEGYRASRTAGEHTGVIRQADTDSYIDPDWTPVNDGAEMMGYIPEVNLTKGGGSSELPTREGQGQTPGRPFGLSPLRRQSQAIAATPDTAGEGVINLRGQEVLMPGQPVRRLGVNVLERKQGPSSPIEQKDTFNPALGQMKTSTLGDAEQAVIDLSHTDANALQRARRGTRSIDETQQAAETIARQRGADLVASWKPGKSFNAEELGAVKAHAGGINQKIDEMQAQYDASGDPQTRRDILNLHEELFKTTAAMVGSKSEAGRALRFLRESIAPVEYDPVTGQAVKQPVSNDPNINAKDRTDAATYLQKLYGDKPVPQIVIDEVSGAGSIDDLLKVLQKQTKVNNKTTIGDTIANVFRAGMLTSPRTFIRNFGGLTANAALRDADSRIGAVLDWAMSKGTKRRTTTAIGLGMLARNAKSSLVEGTREGIDLLRGKGITNNAREAMDRLEFNREQYTGESRFNKVLDGYVNTVFRATAAADLPARKFAFKQSIVEQAQTIAKNEIASGAIKKADYDARVEELASQPTDGMVLEAGIQAEQAAFADSNVLSDKIQGAKRGIYSELEKRGTAGKLGAGALKVTESQIIPFLKTPLNISWDVARRVIFDLPSGVAKGVQVALRKNPMTPDEQKFIAQSIARGGIGVGLSTLGYILGAKGYDILSGTSEQETSGIRETNTVAGKQPGSLTIGGKNYRIQDIASPLSNVLILGYSVGREVHKNISNEESRLKNITGAAAKAVTENPFFSGVERLSELSEPGGVERFAQDTAGTIVPNFVSDTASLFDGTQRESRKQPGDTAMDLMRKSVQRKIPGLRNQLPPRVNALGEVQKEDKANIFDATFSRDARWQNDPAIGELVRLDVGLIKPKRREDENEQQYLARVQRNGDIIKRRLDAVVNADGYNRLSDEQKRKVLDNAVRRGGSINTIGLSPLRRAASSQR